MVLLKNNSIYFYHNGKIEQDQTNENLRKYKISSVVPNGTELSKNIIKLILNHPFIKYNLDRKVRLASSLTASSSTSSRSPSSAISRSSPLSSSSSESSSDPDNSASASRNSPRILTNKKNPK